MWDLIAVSQTALKAQNAALLVTLPVRRSMAKSGKAQNVFVRYCSPLLGELPMHSANSPGISCILLTNLVASSSGSFKGPLGQIIEKQQYPFVKKGFFML